MPGCRARPVVWGCKEGARTLNRRIFVGALTAAVFGGHGRAFSQKTERLPRIGVLVSATPPHPFADAFRRGLQPLGYVEGENITIEWRYTEGSNGVTRKERGIARPHLLAS